MIQASLTGYVSNLQRKTTKNNASFTTFYIKDSFKARDGNWVSRFTNVTCFERVWLPKDLKNDVLVTVYGEYTDNIYTSTEGDPKISRQITADRVVLVPLKPGTSAPETTPAELNVSDILGEDVD